CESLGESLGKKSQRYQGILFLLISLHIVLRQLLSTAQEADLLEELA
ncbi:hypothetical protein CP8484711_1064B, partial [Chlamydia psittaci 84-8471/1]